MDELMRIAKEHHFTAGFDYLDLTCSDIIGIHNL